MIELFNVTHYFRKTLALYKINLKVEFGEKIVLLGPNGSGKSTLLKIIAGLIYPKEGEYYFEGKKIDKKKLKKKEYEKNFRRKVQILFQEPDIMLFNPTVYDEIVYGLHTFGLEQAEERIQKVVELLEIGDLLERPVYLLSGGEKAKVALASVFVIDPLLVLLDEPTAYLDMDSKRRLCHYILKGSFTSIITMHDIHLAKYFGNRFIVLSEEHKIVFDGVFEELLRSDFSIKCNFLSGDRLECRGEG